jgi:hypothetical protein
MAHCSEAPIQLSWVNGSATIQLATTKQGNILLNGLAHIVYPHSFHSRISHSKGHRSFDVVEGDVFFGSIEGPEVWSSTAYFPLKITIYGTIPLREALVFVTAIHKALKVIAECVDSFENLNLRVML